VSSGFRIQDSGFWIQDSGFRIQDSGFWIQDSGFRIQDSGFRILDSGFRIQDSGFRILDSGLRLIRDLNHAASTFAESAVAGGNQPKIRISYQNIYHLSCLAVLSSFTGAWASNSFQYEERKNV